MHSRCVCISPCRIKESEFKFGEIYICKDVINYMNELTEYSMYKNVNNRPGLFLGYAKLNFKRSNFMDFGPYCSLLRDVDLTFEKYFYE